MFVKQGGITYVYLNFLILISNSQTDFSLGLPILVNPTIIYLVARVKNLQVYTAFKS